jgi:hypothetical protein
VIEPVGIHDLLARFANQNDDLLYALAEVETRLLGRRLARVELAGPIFVCGLARAGTTILLELISQHREVASFRYKDFPFVMLPHWWNTFLKVNREGPSAPVERSHADRIQVTPDSPEAMEEILWMRYFPRSHEPSVNNLLGRNRRQPDFDSLYRQTIRKLLLSRNTNRYLAKNNYNITRLDYLVDLFPDARFVIPVRDPVWHIASLMKQHRLLCEEETRDDRVLAYMRRSGHFEFGLDRRPMNLGSTDATRAVQEHWDAGRDVEGWATYWRDVHTYLADLLDQNVEVARASILLPYERLCGDPSRHLTQLYDHLGLQDPALIRRQARILSEPSYYKPAFTSDELGIIETLTGEAHRRVIDRSGPGGNR